MTKIEKIAVSAEWDLMPANRFPGFWEEFGKITIDENRRWSMGINMAGHLFIFTDIPHPGNPRIKAVYHFNPYPSAVALANAIVEDEKREKKTGAE